MAATRYTYETTYETEDSEGNDMPSIEVRFTYTYYAGSEDHYDASVGGPGGWTPGDHEEIEIVGIQAHGEVWREVDGAFHDALLNWAQTKLQDNMRENALEEAKAAYEAAMERRDDERRERDREAERQE